MVVTPAPCLRCGGAGPVEAHHPTGRDHGRPLHPNFTVPLCVHCHCTEHRFWAMAGIMRLPDPGFARAHVVFRRLAIFLAEGDRLAPPARQALAEALVGLAEEVVA